MKAQILVLIPVFNDGSENNILPAMIVNCTDDDDLMNRLEYFAKMNFDAEVKILKDDEPWPTTMERLEG